MVAPTASLAPSQPTTPSPAANDALTQAKAASQSRPQGQRDTLNAQILQASLQVSLQAGNNSMALLYRTAIDGINEYLAPELGPDAIGQAMGQDNSPEGTASRIVSMSTAFFEAYAAQHKNDAPEDVIRNFVELIRGGFEQGFNEASDILNGLGVLGEGSPIAQGINQTFELVQKGYDEFLATKLAALTPKEAPKDTPEAALRA